MLLYKNGNWHLCLEKVRYTQHGEEITQYVGEEGKQWWVDFEKKWDHTKILEFIPVEPTEKQLARYEEIKNMPQDFADVYSNYVKAGEIASVPASHPFNLIVLRRENEELGQLLTDLELRLLMAGEK